MDARRRTMITLLHRLEQRNRDRFDDAVFLLVSRGVWDLEELEAAYERRAASMSEQRRQRERRRPWSGAAGASRSGVATTRQDSELRSTQATTGVLVMPDHHRRGPRGHETDPRSQRTASSIDPLGTVGRPRG